MRLVTQNQSDLIRSQFLDTGNSFIAGKTPLPSYDRMNRSI